MFGTALGQLSSLIFSNSHGPAHDCKRGMRGCSFRCWWLLSTQCWVIGQVSLAIADSCYVVGEHVLLKFLLFKERFHGVADIKNADRFRILAEHRHILKAMRHHSLPHSMDVILGIT